MASEATAEPESAARLGERDKDILHDVLSQIGVMAQRHRQRQQVVAVFFVDALQHIYAAGLELPFERFVFHHPPTPFLLSQHSLLSVITIDWDIWTKGIALFLPVSLFPPASAQEGPGSGHGRGRDLVRVGARHSRVREQPPERRDEAGYRQWDLICRCLPPWEAVACGARRETARRTQVSDFSGQSRIPSDRPTEDNFVEKLFQ